MASEEQKNGGDFREKSNSSQMNIKFVLILLGTVITLTVLVYHFLNKLWEQFVIRQQNAEREMDIINSRFYEQSQNSQRGPRKMV